jgi:hypothetical protein
MEKSIEIEALVFRRMLNHLRERTDVQNIDLMNTAGFCRNCLSNWYEEESNKMEIPVDREDIQSGKINIKNKSKIFYFINLYILERLIDSFLAASVTLPLQNLIVSSAIIEFKSFNVLNSPS